MDILTSNAPRGIDGDIFDVVDENDTIGVIIYFPREDWEEAFDEDEQLEMINEYTFPDWCILSADWEEAEDDTDAADDEIAIEATITFDLSD